MGNNDVKELKQIVDIVDLALNLGLKEATYEKNIRCPFHDDSNPSFAFYRPKNNNGGTFKCFSGCELGGNDIFALVMEYQSMGFKDAINYIAEYAGFKLTKSQNKQPDPLERHYQAIELSQVIYQEIYESSGFEAKNYLMSRNLTEETLNVFEVGYADEKNNLTNRAKKYEKELKDLGLIKEDSLSKKRKYDFFYNRITFPIKDFNGKHVGFGARASSSDTKIKYLNSPESNLFKKNQLLFGYHFYARHNKKRLIITEGYLDVMAMHQIGFKETVGVMGTSLSTEMLNRISNQHNEIIFMFDGDRAGEKIALRCAEEAIKFSDRNVVFKFCFLPFETDPFDIAMKSGAEGINEVINQSLLLSELIIEEVKMKVGLSESSIEGRQIAAHELTKIISSAPKSIFRDALKNEISRIEGVCVEDTPSLTILAEDITGSLNDKDALLLRAADLLKQEFGNQLIISKDSDGGVRVKVF